MKRPLLFLVLLLLSRFLIAQTPSAKIDVKAGVATGDITYTCTPLDLGSFENMFDGDSSTIGRTPDISPMVITLELSTPVALNHAALWEGTDGTWSLETANSLADLNGMTGSYQSHFANVATTANVWSTQNITPATVTVIRLIIHRTACCDDYVHVNEIKLTQAVTNLCLAPNYPNLRFGSSYPMVIAGEDAGGNAIPLIDQTATWSTSNPSIATINSSGLLTAIAIVHP